ncbi:pseudaminic acid synthase [Romboutsia lituseburensis]|uniref:pseudaminic acid synthase n=1 Tax=Romboutsia lituseburensis TaxID=1537 RepID=UPI00215A22DF|nr:pseudaminic acid synthase [Romboutsia lituseburensis]MCR8744765.1 pseudaminic acid synthase [Romboutsia lituseburensis]
MKIENFTIDNNSSCFIIAELSANHGHDIEIAKKTIKSAKECGANAIKLQTYTPDTMTIDCNNEYFKIKKGTLWDGKTLYNLYKEAYTPWIWQRELKEYAEGLGLICFSTPFDKSAVDFLESLSVGAYKIASFEITDIPLIRYAASKKKPMIISTGIATLEEIEDVIYACKDEGNSKIILLKCTSEYPAKAEDANLKTMYDMKNKFDVEVGVSDHSLGIEVPTVAVCLGAKVIEKHFILDKSIGGPDCEFSLEPKDFKYMVDSIRNVEKIIGNVHYEKDNGSNKNREFARSLFIVKDMKIGEILTEENVKSIRPGFGLKPKFYNNILGKKINKNVKKGTPLTFDLIN